MTVATPTTLMLATLLGAYLVAGGIGGFVYGHRWREVLDDFERSPALVLVTGAIAFVTGGAVVAVHNLWTDPVAVIVTLFGWASLIEGFVILAAHDWWLRLARPLIGRPQIWAAITLVLGAFLLAAGLFGRADPTLL